jgi:ferric enterobactin receptor
MGTPNRLTWLLSASLVFLAPSVSAHAQPQPTPVPASTQASEDEEHDDIVVLAEPGDQVRIDRRTYTLRDDATAQSTNMFDVLGRIPSVSVAPSGEITLLGASNVTIQINGQPVPGGNLEQILRGLPGSDVERIEVITNPSAQYSAQASGGIINIITRQRFNAGFNGTLQAGADSLGGYHVGLAPSWSRGPWTFSGQVGVYGGEQENNLTREREEFPGGAITTEDGGREFEFNGWYAGRLQASYQPNAKRRMSLSLDAGDFNFDQVQSSDLTDDLGPLETRESVRADRGENNQLTFDFQQDGDAPRELIRFNAALSQFVNTSELLFSSTPDGGFLSQYSTLTEQDTTGLSVKLDIEQPFEEERFLTLGAAFDQSEQTIETVFDVLTGVGPPEYEAALEGASQTLAVYATYQFGMGDWTILPGARAEAYRREVASGGLESDDVETRLFPSIHVRRELTSSINIDLSYTSRIQRPGFQQLDPALRFVDVDRAFSGNPNLEPTTTDAFEANFIYQKNGASFSVTFFDRISDDVVSQFTDVNGDGVIVSMPVNAGESQQRGVQALLRGPLGERWRYSLSGNLLSREFDYLSGGGIERRSEIEYDGIAQLDYRDPDQEAIGADQLQFEVRFQGPRHGLQTEIDEFIMANFTWRRRITPRLQGVFMVQDIFDSTDQISEVTTDDYFERTEFESPGARFRIALTYQFGDGPRRPIQDQQPGPPPVPQF